MPWLDIANDCSAFSNALLISLTLTQRLPPPPPPLDSVPPLELFEPSGLPKTSRSSRLEPVDNHVNFTDMPVETKMSYF